MTARTYRKWHAFPAVPRYLVPLARRIKALHEIVHAGVIIDSPGVIAEVLPDGRIRLRAGSGARSVALTPPPPLGLRPTTLNTVIAAGTTLGLWPRPGVAVPTTLNEVITAGTTLALWPRPALLTPTTLNEVIIAGAALNLWS